MKDYTGVKTNELILYGPTCINFPNITLRRKKRIVKKENTHNVISIYIMSKICKVK